jgi:vacuolar-type H+-ATPase subunit E/Vma4
VTAAEGTLDAVRQAELRAASDEADAIRRAADRHADGIVTQARADADGLIARRRAAAEQLAVLEERERLAEARAQARGTVLRAQRSVLTEPRAPAPAPARGLAGDARLERLLERLADDARQRLAPAGAVQAIAASDGGFVARAGSREIDYSIGAQVDRILEGMASELERLWR